MTYILANDHPGASTPRLSVPESLEAVMAPSDVLMTNGMLYSVALWVRNILPANSPDTPCTIRAVNATPVA